MHPLKTCLVLFLLGCLSSAARADVVDASVCEVLESPASFDGKTLRLQGVTVIAGFDEFVIEGTGCKSSAGIWLAYPEGTRGKAGPRAFLRLQVAKNGAAGDAAPQRAPVKLERNKDFGRFDSLLAAPYKSSALCLGCPRNRVSATLVGRLDGVSVAGVLRDESGKVTGIAGFGNANLYRARFVLQSVSEVVPREVDYSAGAIAVKGDSRRASMAHADQVNRGVAAFGEQGESNGVLVGFGVVNEVSPKDTARGESDSPDGILFDAIFDMDRLGKDALPNAMAHVGTHIADVRGRVALQGVEEAELRAWQATFVR